MYRIYLLFVSLAVVLACSQPLHASAEKADCNSESNKLADAVCGEYVRETRSERHTRQSLPKRQALTLSEIERVYQDQEFASKYPIGNFIERVEAYSVPHEDLLKELSDTRLCRIKMTSLAFGVCLENNCNTNCRTERQEARDRAAKAKKGYETCRKGKRSECVVNCRANSNSGMDFHSPCKSLCERIDDSVCDEKLASVYQHDNFEQNYTSCVVQCERRAINHSSVIQED